MVSLGTSAIFQLYSQDQTPGSAGDRRRKICKQFTRNINEERLWVPKRMRITDNNTVGMHEMQDDACTLHAIISPLHDTSTRIRNILICKRQIMMMKVWLTSSWSSPGHTFTQHFFVETRRMMIENIISGRKLLLVSPFFQILHIIFSLLVVKMNSFSTKNAEW